MIPPELHRDTPPVGESFLRRIARQWRWYHFYFLLAMFDVIVISMSLLLYDHMIRSYRRTLVELRRVEEQQRWSADLRLSLVALNAPGNDVFESRDVAAERARFDRAQARVEALLQRGSESQMRLEDFRRELARMMAEEQTIFDCFSALNQQNRTVEEQQRQHERASASMAAMDRAQAAALGDLFNLENLLVRDKSRLLDEFGSALERSAATEKYLFGMIILILAGVFWYGRILQRTYDQMIAEQQRLASERHERLAAVGEVCSTVAHGIRNPLAAIISSAQLALELGGLDEQTAPRIQDVLDESRRLDRRVTRLLDFSRVPERGFQRFALTAVIEQAIRSLEPRMSQSTIRIETQIDPAPLAIYGDPERFAQAIIELLSNAMECQPNGGRIQVVCRRGPAEDAQAFVSVIDDGPGIPEKIRTRVFDLFFTSKPGGHGIGLASVRRTIELHGGRVSVAPSEGKGTHIEIVVPTA